MESVTAFILYFFSLQNHEQQICIVYKSLNLWHLFTAAHTDYDNTVTEFKRNIERIGQEQNLKTVAENFSKPDKRHPATDSRYL